MHTTYHVYKVMTQLAGSYTIAIAITIRFQLVIIAILKAIFS